MKKQINILIADDNQIMRQSLKLLISEMENAVLTGEATNGEDAIALAAKLLPDVILMDVNMSPVNGFEATRKILIETPDAKIIGVSLHQRPLYTRNMLSLGAKGYVAKSAPHQEVIEAINTVASGGKYVSKDIEE
ncbi:MAG TPA: response regulator transcription factor [Chitinophagaceae bacterium]